MKPYGKKTFSPNTLVHIASHPDESVGCKNLGVSKAKARRRGRQEAEDGLYEYYENSAPGAEAR